MKKQAACNNTQLNASSRLTNSNSLAYSHASRYPDGWAGDMLPIYAQVARRSYVGQGSLALLENLLPEWRGKLFVLVLLGFAGADFVITMTLSAADAAQHAIENPYLHVLVGSSRIAITVGLLALLALVFLLGFKASPDPAVPPTLRYGASLGGLHASVGAGPVDHQCACDLGLQGGRRGAGCSIRHGGHSPSAESFSTSSRPPCCSTAPAL